jgi:hypothetical protein
MGKEETQLWDREREWFEHQQKSQAFSETYNIYGSDQRT